MSSASPSALLDQALAPAQMAIDLDQLQRLALIKDPGSFELVDLARLHMRYGANPNAALHRAAIDQQLDAWGLELEQLFEKTRAIWASGYRPEVQIEQAVGSGSDVSEG